MVSVRRILPMKLFSSYKRIYSRDYSFRCFQSIYTLEKTFRKKKKVFVMSLTNIWIKFFVVQLRVLLFVSYGHQEFLSTIIINNILSSVTRIGTFLATRLTAKTFRTIPTKLTFSQKLATIFHVENVFVCGKTMSSSVTGRWSANT